MTTTQIVLTTILSMVGVITFGKWFMRVADMEYNLWIEPTVIAAILLFIYLILN